MPVESVGATGVAADGARTPSLEHRAGATRHDEPCRCGGSGILRLPQDPVPILRRRIDAEPWRHRPRESSARRRHSLEHSALTHPTVG